MFTNQCLGYLEISFGIGSLGYRVSLGENGSRDTLYHDTIEFLQVLHLTWWQGGLFKLSMVSIGLALAATWPRLFVAWRPILWVDICLVRRLHHLGLVVAVEIALFHPKAIPRRVEFPLASGVNLARSACPDPSR